MNKILAVADIHIHDYPNRFPPGHHRYRLGQGSRIVAQNIIDAGKKYGCDYIVFAGDVIEHAIIHPYVQAEVKIFLDTIMSNFKEGWLIYGNHDIDNKGSDQSISDSCLGVMLPENLHYAHQTQIQMDGVNIGFNNWQPEIDLSWVQGKLDILFTHAEICYNGDEFFESQALDESKFTTAFCGHIHRAAQTDDGKYISIGIPQKCKMGDSDDATGVVITPGLSHWEWVNLNPNNNLMKFVYTADLDMADTWDEKSMTYYVYKQDASEIDLSQQMIRVAAWEEIEGMINEAIAVNNLQGVHQEVLRNIKNIEAGEVDFGFTLLKLHAENWRSIEDVTIDFKAGDKILIQGGNGSGKSSLLSAIKYAFVDVSDTVGLTSLKPFIQFGAKDCMTEVEFLYKGNLCKIRRGTKVYGLWINGEEMKYNNKKLFEEDVRVRFPFVSYMDAFFFDTDHHKFLGGMSPERKTEIISKFLRLDKIDTYNETAEKMSWEFRKDADMWKAKVSETEKLIAYIDDKLATIVVPAVSKADLEKQKEEGLALQRANDEWNKYNNLTASLTAQINSYQDKIAELDLEIGSFRDPGTIDFEISQIQGEIQNQQGRLVELGSARNNMNFKNAELQRVTKEATDAWNEAGSIGVGKICTHCGQVIKTSEAMEAHKNELLLKVESLKPQILALRQEVADLQNLVQNSQEEYNQVNQYIAQLNSEVSKRMSEKSHQASVIAEKTKYDQLLGNARNQLASVGVVPRVDLPSDFMSKMSDIQSGIAAWNLWETNMTDRGLRDQERQTYQANLDSISACLVDLDAYIRLTGPTGVIYEEIMNKLKDQFSDNLVRYVVDRKGKGNREHLSLNPQYYNNGNWVDYSACSAGQITILDLHCMTKLISNLGLLVFDEYLKHLSPENLDIALEMISGLNVGCIMLSSHMETVSAFNNRSFELSLNDSGLTQIKIS